MAMLNQLRTYVPYAWNFAVRRSFEPIICGIAITDRCNLHCRACHVSNLGAGDMSFSAVSERLRTAYDRGCREAYFTGGEPMLWTDEGFTVENLIEVARHMGYFHVHVYTNGTLGLDCSADLVWVSMDGLPGTYEKRRGDHFATVEHAIRHTPHPPLAVIYVVDRFTAGGVEPFLRWVRATELPVRGVMIYFHTPYYGIDELYLTADERAPVIDRLITLKREGLPLLNSHAGLVALKTGNWPRRMPVALVGDASGESLCCRAPDSVCPDCGYGACTELSAAQRLRPSAVIGMARYL
ncbi:MAG: radical SAM protein [Coriobacteriia bacterium]|nr:radical SAM protein [Coriobacteriia bacterium]